MRPSAIQSARTVTTPLILLADDFEDGRDLYYEYLTFRGYRVALAVDGHAAIEQARRERPDVVLMDVRMPGMNGTDAMRVMKSDVALADVPIIAFTAHALEEEQRDALLAGFDAVLPKPCLPNDLADFIDLVLKSRART